MEIAPKPVKYEVAVADYVGNLEVEVNALIARGFRPHGSMVVVTEDSDEGRRYQFCQPMVKES